MSTPAYNNSPTDTALIIAEPVGLQPEQQMKDAEHISKVLKSYLKRKKRQVVFNGTRYPEADDWNLVAAFFGYTAKVIQTTELKSQEGEVIGYLTHADLIRDRDGIAVSAAEAQCSRDENNWANPEKKPAFQLRSMSQTRACAKAIKNKFAWVMVLAGLSPTPAEEMTSGDLPAALCVECGFSIEGADEVYNSRKVYGKTLCRVCRKKATPLDEQVQKQQEKLAAEMKRPVVNEHKRAATLQAAEPF